MSEKNPNTIITTNDTVKVTGEFIVSSTRGILGFTDWVGRDEMDEDCILVNLDITIDKDWFKGPMVKAVIDKTPDPIEVTVTPTRDLEL